MENEKYHFHSAICARTVLCGEMIAVRTGRQKILLFSMLSFVCFSSSTSESEIFTSSCCFFCVKRFFPFSNVNANLNRQLWWFLFRYIFHFYIWYPPAYVRSCAYKTKKPLPMIVVIQVNENGRLCRSLILLLFWFFVVVVVVVFAWDPVNIRLSDLLNVTLS